jgi:hypothetical protein
MESFDDFESSGDLFEFEFEIEAANITLERFEASHSSNLVAIPSSELNLTENSIHFEDSVEFPALTENALVNFLQLPRSSNFIDGCHLLSQNDIPCSEMEIKLVEDLVKAKCDLKSAANKKINKEVYKSQLAKFVCKVQFNCSEVEFVKKTKSIKNVILRVLTTHHLSQTKTDRKVQNKHEKYRDPQDYKNVVKLCREKNNMFNTFKDLKYATSTVSSSNTMMSIGTVSSKSWDQVEPHSLVVEQQQAPQDCCDGLDVLLGMLDGEIVM